MAGARGPAQVLVAGVGNIFPGDDGFGVEVVRRMAARPLPDGVRAADFGIRSLHLAYELADHPEATAILVDAMARGGAPGTVYVIEPDPAGQDAVPDAGAHGVTPDGVLALVRALGGAPGRVLVVGCEPADCEERMGAERSGGRGRGHRHRRDPVGRGRRVDRDPVLSRCGHRMNATTLHAWGPAEAGPYDYDSSRVRAGVSRPV
jgi:hydrogenase maturation protease